MSTVNLMYRLHSDNGCNLTILRVQDRVNHNRKGLNEHDLRLERSKLYIGQAECESTSYFNNLEQYITPKMSTEVSSCNMKDTIFFLFVVCVM